MGQSTVSAPVARERFLGSGAARLYTRDIGAGPPVVVVHGGPDFDHRYLLPEMDLLAESCHVVYYDQRGRGRSWSGEVPDVTVAGEVDDLDRVRTASGPVPSLCVGHSWGGLIAMEYAVRRPAGLSRLVLMNTAPASHDDAMVLRDELARRKTPEQLARMHALAADPGFLAGDPVPEAEYYRIHYGLTLRRQDHVDAVVGRLRAAFTPAGILAARAIEQELYDQTWSRDGYDLIPALERRDDADAHHPWRPRLHPRRTRGAHRRCDAARRTGRVRGLRPLRLPRAARAHGGDHLRLRRRRVNRRSGGTAIATFALQLFGWREPSMTVLVQLIQPGVWNVWAEDDRHVVQAIVERIAEPVPRIVERFVDGARVSILVDENDVELARSGAEPS